MPIIDNNLFFTISFSDFLHAHPITTIVYAKEYPHTLVTGMYQSVVQQGYISSVFDIQDWNSLSKEQLDTTFLGQQKVIFITVLQHTLTSEQYGMLKNLIYAYHGPHMMVFILPKTVDVTVMSINAHGASVMLPEKIDASLYGCILQWLGISMTHAMQNVIKTIFAYDTMVSLSHLLSLSMYIPLLSDNDTFCTDWFTRLFVTEESLFTLNTHFFQQKPNLFFNSWLGHERLYPAPFWIAFWSEQLYRAALYVDCMQEKKLLEAKQVSHKLPFSFINRDWKKYTVTELSRAHHWLYSIDFYAKNNQGTFTWESFFLLFFNRYFADSFSSSASHK